MLELFVIGSFWFWALIAAEIILLFVFVEYENGIGATISLAVFAALLQWCGNVDLIGYVIKHPINVLMAGLAYLLLGTIWGVIKWRIFCADRLDDYEDLKSDYLKGKGLPAGTKVVPVELRKEWSDRVERTRDYHTKQTIADVPSVRVHKARIMRWMSLWVISVIWSLFNDFLKRVFQSVYKRIAGFLQRIAQNVWSGGNVADDLNVPSEAPRNTEN
jgi:hypothetical protein